MIERFWLATFLIAPTSIKIRRPIFFHFPIIPMQSRQAHQSSLARRKNLWAILIISVAYAHEAVQELGISLQQHLQRLIVHGMCHLIGYDHETDADYKIMRGMACSS